MPHYEFLCHNCKKFFAKILSLVDCEEGEVLCPHCGSKNVEQRWSPFSAITSKKSACREVLWRVRRFAWPVALGEDAICTLQEIVAVVERSQDIEDEEAMRFFGGEEGDADLSQR